MFTFTLSYHPSITHQIRSICGPINSVDNYEMTLDKQTLNVARNTTRIVHSFIAFRKRKTPWTKTILFKTCAVIDRNNSHWQKQQSQQKTTSLNPLPLKKKFCLFCTYVFFTTYTMLTRWKLRLTEYITIIRCFQFDYYVYNLIQFSVCSLYFRQY